jgi:hypothetical protein
MDIKNVIIGIVGLGEFILGAMFLMNTASDIQIGFGIILLAQGIIHLTK